MALLAHRGAGSPRIGQIPAPSAAISSSCLNPPRNRGESIVTATERVGLTQFLVAPSRRFSGPASGLATSSAVGSMFRARMAITKAVERGIPSISEICA